MLTILNYLLATVVMSIFSVFEYVSNTKNVIAFLYLYICLFVRLFVVLCVAPASSAAEPHSAW